MTRGIAAMTAATAALVSGCSVGAPPKDFAIEDAVLAMRVHEGGEDSSYLVLVSPEGKTRAIELEGVEGAGISWTEHGITTSDPKHDYVIDESGLTDNKRTSGDKSLETSHEWYRVQVGAGTLVGFSPADSSKDPFVTYIDGESGKTTTRVSPYGETSTAAVCGERVFAPGRGTGTKAFEEDSESIPEEQWDRAALTSAYPHDGTDMLSTLEPTGPGATSPCADGIVYEGWENDDDQDFVRTWNTAKGTPAAKAAVDHEIVYPKDASSQIGGPSAVTVVDGQLVWVVENTMWSAPLPSAAAGPVEAREVGYLEGYVGLDAEVLAYSSNAAYTVTNETDLHERKWSRSRHSDRVWTELTELSLVRTDPATGEPSIALEIDMKDVDFPTKDASVTALAIDPAWLAKKGE
ncbi:hypothetical protein ACIA03_14230 [Nocardioides sp. NPDC051685]|uniref:hypothetical protein n=1 Tax=Nocardioides sp. NPDC051685 TaxID=3364334 RepID=UPI00378B17A4